MSYRDSFTSAQNHLTAGHDAESHARTRGEQVSEVVKAQSTRLLFTNGRAGAVSAMLVAVAICAYFFNITPTLSLLSWFVAMLAVTLWRIHIVARYNRASPNDSDLRFWHSSFLQGSTVGALLLGSSWWIIAPQASFEDLLLLTFALGGTALGAISTLGSSITAYIIYSIALAGQSAIWYFMQGSVRFATIGMLVSVLTVALIAACRGQNKTLARLLTVTDANRELHEHQQRLGDFATLGADLFWEADTQGCYSYLSEDYEFLTGVLASSMIGKPLTDPSGPCFIPKDHLHRCESFVDHCVSWTAPGSDKTAVLLSSARKVIDAQGKAVGLRGTVRDITAEHVLSQELQHQANHDALTGLVNRREFEKRLQQVLDDAHENGHEHCVCYLDLDQFKVVNDTSGHAAGDALLCQIANELNANVRSRDTLARLGGDEFGLILEHCDGENSVSVAQTARATVEAMRFAWETRTFNLTVSVGLVMVSADCANIEEVMKRADAACYGAKDGGRNRVQSYEIDDIEMSKRQSEMQWVSRITDALDHKGFYLVAQPIVALQGNAGDIGKSGNDAPGVHFEMLLRMRGEKGEPISPALFLPAAERYQLATRLDRWVIDTALEWLQESAQRSAQIDTCSINLSGHSITDESFLNDLLQRLHHVSLPCEKICFEITETAVMNNLDSAASFIERVKALGCRFALDDFGSGSSSFGYLKKLPVDIVKIDGVFVRDMLNDDVDLSMVKAINDIGHIMGKKTVAEYVESDELCEKLRSLGVDYAQGYATGRPGPLDDVLQPLSCADSAPDNSQGVELARSA